MYLLQTFCLHDRNVFKSIITKTLSILGGSLPSRFNSSFRSSNSGHSSIAGGLTSMFQQPSSCSVIEGQLRLRYSGEEGFKADYCRSCSVFFLLEMMPSLHITNWDVMPAETYVYELIIITNLKLLLSPIDDTFINVSFYNTSCNLRFISFQCKLVFRHLLEIDQLYKNVHILFLGLMLVKF